MKFRNALLAATVAATALTGCQRSGDIVIEQGVGITALRSVCPAVGVPDFTGNVTLFTPAGARTADAIDVTAALTNVRSQCEENGAAEVFSTATFDVLAQRRDTRGARSVTLPYYSTVVRGGNAVIAKRLGSVTLNFADGQDRAFARGTAGAVIDRAAATLPAEIRERITRRRSGEADAAIDPLNEPEVRAALARASFELLVGFQLTEDQLAYNATR